MVMGPRSALWPEQNQFRAGQVSTGSVGGTGQASVTLTWPVPFDTDDYTVVASVLEATAGSSLRALHIVSQTETQVVVRVVNDSAIAKTGTLHVLAMGGEA